MKFRHEYKHQINLADIYGLRTRLSAVARHDPHAGEDGTYSVKSLYFDNYMDKALREKQDGVRIREKFRIRYYGCDTSFIKLEKKSKINGLCNKVSCPITAQECQKIIDGDFEFLLHSEHELMRELYAKIKYQLLRPKCIVAYTRECFVYPPGNVRVTLDMNICGSNNIKEFLNPDLQFLHLFRNTVLEVKWDEYLPQIIRDCVQVKGRQSAAFSKYAAVRF
ncbi:MAG: polyphosphate polymerase domain-containing protein [Ruminococcaceae bacterium]|nr:polyphosphate polymerase domain-containing protein [Oscillospiraceae bacterium]